MPQAFGPIERPPSLHHSVQGAIRAYILENGLRAGDALPPENELARQLGVGRNSVREAVKALDSLGVLEARRGSGLFVRAFSFQPLIESLPYGLLIDLQALAELLEIRRVLETGMIEPAIGALAGPTLQELRLTVDRMGARAARGEAFADEDRRFHRLLFEGLGNRTLLTLLEVFWLTFRQAAEHADIGNTDPLRTYRDHAAIVEAVAAGDAAEARRALERHYEGITERLAQASDGETP
jgi:DNA-binding FadR family transcriptional regulator